MIYQFDYRLNTCIARFLAQHMPCQASRGHIVITVYQLLKEPYLKEIIDQYVGRSVTPFVIMLGWKQGNQGIYILNDGCKSLENTSLQNNSKTTVSQQNSEQIWIGLRLWKTTGLRKNFTSSFWRWIESLRKFLNLD